MAFGRAIIIGQIERNLKLKATIKTVTLGFPLSINISELDIKGLMKADSVFASPSILGFLAGKVVFNELRIINPQIIIIKNSDGKLNIPEFKPKGKQPPILLAALKITSGKLIFIDKKVNPQGHRIAVDNINVNIAKSAFPPTSLYTRFDISAFLEDSSNNPSGTALARGWIDFRPKDMEGKIELKDIDAVSLAPYYRNFIPAENLVSPKLNFTADLKAENNNLAIKCHVEFRKQNPIKENPPDSKEEASGIIPDVLNLFSDASGKITFDFVINTKLDNPRFDLINLKGTIAQTAVQNIASQPPEEVVEKAKEVAKQFKDLGKSLKDIFKKKE